MYTSHTHCTLVAGPSAPNLVCICPPRYHSVGINPVLNTMLKKSSIIWKQAL